MLYILYSYKCELILNPNQTAGTNTAGGHLLIILPYLLSPRPPALPTQRCPISVGSYHFFVSVSREQRAVA